jgi:hypothetical protein
MIIFHCCAGYKGDINNVSCNALTVHVFAAMRQMNIFNKNISFFNANGGNCRQVVNETGGNALNCLCCQFYHQELQNVQNYISIAISKAVNRLSEVGIKVRVLVMYKSDKNSPFLLNLKDANLVNHFCTLAVVSNIIPVIQLLQPSLSALDSIRLSVEVIICIVKSRSTCNIDQRTAQGGKSLGQRVQDVRESVELILISDDNNEEKVVRVHDIMVKSRMFYFAFTKAECSEGGYSGLTSRALAIVKDRKSVV